jgi:hypothetical protein
MPKTAATIRWTIQKAATEFDRSRETITKGIKAHSIEPGVDGKYSTKQIAAAIYGDWDSSRLKNDELDAAIKEEKLKKLRTLDYVRMSFVVLLWRSMVNAWKQKIINSQLPQELKEELTADMQEIPIEEYARTAIADSGSEDNK